MGTKRNNSGLFKNGHAPTKPKGAVNHLTKTVKETVLAVFQDLQGNAKHNLKAFAEKYPRDFYQIAAKLIPTEIKGDVRVTKVILEIDRTTKIITEQSSPQPTESN